MTDLNRARGRIAFWALAGLALLVSHDAVFVTQIGPGEQLTAALRSAGHDWWGVASVILVGIAGLMGAITLVRIARLRRAAAALDARGRAQTTRLALLLPTWGRTAAVVVIGFAIQENVEHFIAHGHAIGAGALIGPEYPLALPVLAIVTLVAALGATLLMASERELVTAIVAALRRRLRPMRVAIRPARRVAPPIGSVIARFLAGRAPPSTLQYQART